MNDEIFVRSALAGDLPFIFKTVVLGTQKNNFQFKMIERQSFETRIHRRFEKIISLPQTQVLVVCAKDDPDTVLSFIIASIVDNTLLVHYVYTKLVFRNNKFAKILVGVLLNQCSNKIIYATHLSFVSSKIMGKHKDIKYNELLLDDLLFKD